MKDAQLILVGKILCTKFEKSQRVYSTEGISPTITTRGGGEIKIKVR